MAGEGLSGEAGVGADRMRRPLPGRRVVEWFARRETGDRFSSGSARFSLEWDPASGKITSESGTVIETDKERTRPTRICRDGRTRTSSAAAGRRQSETLAACDRREKVDAKLKGVGWCYGREGEARYQMEWHPCDGRGRGNPVRCRFGRPRLPESGAIGLPEPQRLSGKTMLPDFKEARQGLQLVQDAYPGGYEAGTEFAGTTR